MTLSIIIPTLNESRFITGTLESIANQEDVDVATLEVIVVDGGSEDNTVRLVEEFRDKNPMMKVCPLRSERGRAVQLNAGAKAAHGEIFLFLHGDTRLSPNALSELLMQLGNSKEQFGYFSMKMDSDHPLATIYGAATHINSILLHFGDCGIFARKAFFFETGLFPKLDLMEDVEFLMRARAKSEPLLVKNAFVRTSARRFQKNGFLWQQLLNAGLVGLYILGADTALLKKVYD
ncbi:MAG: glycosyltransferase family 2 protein [Chlorobiales bacterium]|jgi:rSAM/selenodomain-associated transferase 2|nr:glycosyltransferase family 2 protein [Chlorobiales bacterium]